MADSDSIDSIGSKEKQDVDIFVNNTCYEKTSSKQEFEKNIAVELADMVGKGSTDYQWEVQCLEYQ